ncbi:hypothetical protein F441_10784 [Phytophthora nicotianae CJ01A1]|uniref:Uncharacterized protein n=4 Tax=Phytophthora nicotianae TaxID=4792 RepID=W2Z4X8_PHYNI|nr:hypothetical protein L915_10594 [Phytophthora nicotianae]ETO73114.1 hypothetical protein F444_10921 [Phytophthora nicotianae P1976]ETP14263.1 hypothetical protein F441_10784 [Phytophthora nicotianae CJ01A1]ETP42323.1 hypothetical protein F442_10761 [Phytophthora nicotianae P10297]ETL37876.1 hypothetical protein L916_10486 [Phytophthora nicotianae]
MSSEAISTGSIVFVGPTHESPLEGFMYLLVTKVKGTSAIVRKTGPDATDSCPEFEVKGAVLCHRIVSEEGSEL